MLPDFEKNLVAMNRAPPATRMHAAAIDIIFIGDMYDSDVIGAHNAGIKAAWLNKKDGSDTDGLASFNCTSAEQLFNILAD